MLKYPDVQGFGPDFARAELSCAGRIFTAISQVEIDQPTEEGVIMGTRPEPLGRTEGSMGLGTGTITFTDDRERAAFLEHLGDGFRSKLWEITWIFGGKGAEPTVHAADGCRVLGNPVSHGLGGEALGGDISFSFMSHTFNGLSPHE